MLGSQTEPLVSVMMPVYNGEQTIQLAIASLLHQTYTNWKCVIVNDGSTDSTKEFLDTLKDPRFYIIHFPENKGRPVARQAALEAAEGEFLAFLDADDFYHPQKLEKQVKAFQEYPEIDLVSCGMGSFKTFDRIERVRGVRSSLINRVMKFRLTGDFNAPHPACMTRLSLSKQVPYNKHLKHAQDSDFFIRYLENRKYLIVGDVLYYYSEFVSVTGRKILRTYKYDIMRKVSLVPKAPFIAGKSLLKTIGKFIVTAVFLPLKGAEFFLRRRGGIPSSVDVAQYNTVRSLLKLDSNG